MSYDSFFFFPNIICCVKDTSRKCNSCESKQACMLELCCARYALRAWFTWQLHLAWDVELTLAQVEAGSLVLVEVNGGSQEGSEQ